MAPDFLLSKLFSLMALFAFVQTLLPPPLRSSLTQAIDKFWTWLFNSADPSSCFEVPEINPGGHRSFNVFYRQVSLYLGSLAPVHQMQRVNVYRIEAASSLSYSLPENVSLEDSFRGAKMVWMHTCTGEQEGENQRRSFTLTMLKSDRSRLLADYFQHISNCAGEIERRNTKRFLYTNNYRGWEDVSFNHPATFDTVALEADLTDRIKADLQAFSQGEDYYHRIGRAWKRGYLLYGPPGTGKSSMIAAIANFLHYDIFDLELTKVSDNAQLKSLLMQTKRKSVIVIEDIDCSADFSDRSETAKDTDTAIDSEAGAPIGHRRLTLSGLLNFTDGLWSCCGEERIFIFTTNHKERLDPALLRSGRMDLHILLSYLTFGAFKKLAENYLGIKDHELYGELEAAMEGGGKVTPATVAEVLMSNKCDADAAVRQVMKMVLASETHEKDDDLQLGQPIDTKPTPLNKRSFRQIALELVHASGRNCKPAQLGDSRRSTRSRQGQGTRLQT